LTQPNLDMQDLNSIGTRILFENELIRIWEVDLQPGEHQGFHQHHHPYVVISVAEGENKITAIDGTERYTTEPVGHFVYQDAGQIHDLQNIGTTQYRNRLIEIKVPVGKGEGSSEG